MRRLNAALLLNIIRDKGRVSRAELARLSGLTKPTVSSQVSDLIGRGIVVEDGEGAPDARGGKPPTMLRFNPDAGAILAAEICSSTIRVWLADLDGRPVESASSAIRPEFGAAHVLDVLCSTMHGLLAGAGRRRSLLSAAIAAPGRVDANTGTVLEAGNVFHWRNVEVGKRIEDHFGVAAVVDNDVNLAALGEMHSGLANGVQNFILIRHGTGVGAGLVLGGRLYHGTHWAAGEIGHMIFERASVGEQDAVERGLLEMAIGSDRVRERVISARAGARGGDESPGGDLAAQLVAELADLVSRNDETAERVLDEVASQISMAVADMAAVIDPELIVLAGELFGLIAGRIRELVGRIIPWPVRIELSALGADAALMGAIGAARSIAHDLLCGVGPGEIRLSAPR